MRRFLSAALLLALATAAEAGTRVVLLHFSDYHSHATPFYSEGRPAQGGIAHAIGYLEREHRRGALVFNGGDMINRGSPAWSDKYGCAEWRWLNGVVDAMALGNHDADYGREAFERCRGDLRFPILSANTEGFRRTLVFTTHGIRIGVFAIAGSDFQALAKAFTYTDRVEAARAAVAELRKSSDVIVMIGHETTDEDYELARAVPGIDVIFGTHSHHKQELTKIPGTRTWFISPYQYLAYISRVELHFDGARKLSRVTGRLVRVDAKMAADRAVAARVARMERELERDPAYAPLFSRIGELPAAVPVDELGQLAVEKMRSLTSADVALSTKSSFRQALPPGTVTPELLRAALPYDNEIVVAPVPGSELTKILALARGAGNETAAYVTSPPAVDATKVYSVAATDYLARVSPYKQFFTGEVKSTGLHVREEVRKALAK